MKADIPILSDLKEICLSKKQCQHFNSKLDCPNDKSICNYLKDSAFSHQHSSYLINNQKLSEDKTLRDDIDDGQAIPKISKLLHGKPKNHTYNDSYSNHINISINIFTNANVMTKPKDQNESMVTSNTLNYAQVGAESTKDGKRMSNRWKKLKNVIKTINFLHQYEAVSLKEVDIERNLRDYRERLFPHSPLIKLPNKQKLLKPKNISKETKKNSDNYLGKLMKRSSSLKINNQFGHEAHQSELLSGHPIKCLPGRKICAESLNMRNESSIQSSYFDDSDYLDEVQVEMNKISLIEQIKNYVLE